MITERTLRQYRKNALDLLKILNVHYADEITIKVVTIKQVLDIILRITQELLDQHLMRK